VRASIFALVMLSLPAWAGSDLTLLDGEGSPVVVAPAAGEVVLLHFWATWCPTCAEDLAILEHAASACAPGQVRVYAVNLGEPEAEIADFVREHRVGLPVLRDPKGRAWRALDGRGVPLNVYWSEEGRRTDVGPKTADDWEAEFRRLGCSAP